MSDAPVVWVITDPLGHMLGPVFADESDAEMECRERNARINNMSGMRGRYCRAKPVALITAPAQ